MGGWSIWHWLVVLLVILLIFGTKKLRHIGSDMGNAVKGFKEAMSSAEDAADESEQIKPSLMADNKKAVTQKRSVANKSTKSSSGTTGRAKKVVSDKPRAKSSVQAKTSAKKT